MNLLVKQPFAQHPFAKGPRARRYGTALICAALLGLAGCAEQRAGWKPPDNTMGNTMSTADPSTQRYRCGEGVNFTAVVNDESAVLDGAWGKATLLRDAGGQGFARVYSNRNLRAEFGLGPDGRTAALHELTGLDSTRRPMHLSCRRE